MISPAGWNWRPCSTDKGSTATSPPPLTLSRAFQNLREAAGIREERAVDPHCLVAGRRAFDAVQAAALPETYFTVWANLFQIGRLTAGETVLVHGGSSGIGVTAIKLAKARPTASWRQATISERSCCASERTYPTTDRGTRFEDHRRWPAVSGRPDRDGGRVRAPGRDRARNAEACHDGWAERDRRRRPWRPEWRGTRAGRPGLRLQQRRLQLGT